MHGAYEQGEKLVWIHVDDETGQKLNDMVVIMNKREYPRSVYYTVQIEATGEIANAWHDELYRWSQ